MPNGLFDVMMKRYGSQPSGEQATPVSSRGSFGFQSPMPRGASGVPGSFMGGMMGMGRMNSRPSNGLVNPGVGAASRSLMGRY